MYIYLTMHPAPHPPRRFCCRDRPAACRRASFGSRRVTSVSDSRRPKRRTQTSCTRRSASSWTGATHEPAKNVVAGGSVDLVRCATKATLGHGRATVRAMGPQVRRAGGGGGVRGMGGCTSGRASWAMPSIPPTVVARSVFGSCREAGSCVSSRAALARSVVALDNRSTIAQPPRTADRCRHTAPQLCGVRS